MQTIFKRFSVISNQKSRYSYGFKEDRGKRYLYQPEYYCLVLLKLYSITCYKVTNKTLKNDIASYVTLKQPSQDTRTVSDRYLSKHNIIMSLIKWLAYYTGYIVEEDSKLAGQMA